MGKFYKIRLELIPKSAEKKPSWKVNVVKLTNVESEETLVFHFDRWLSREHEDMEIMRELPAIWPGEETPPGKCHISLQCLMSADNSITVLFFGILTTCIVFQSSSTMCWYTLGMWMKQKQMLRFT